MVMRKKKGIPEAWKVDMQRTQDNWLKNASYQEVVTAFSNLDERRAKLKRRDMLRGTGFINDPFR